MLVSSAKNKNKIHRFNKNNKINDKLTMNEIIDYEELLEDDDEF